MMSFLSLHFSLQSGLNSAQQRYSQWLQCTVVLTLSKSPGPDDLQTLWQVLHMAVQIDQGLVTVTGTGVVSKVGGSVGGSVWASVWGSIGGSVGGSVWGSVWGSVGGSEGGSVWGSVGGSVGGSVSDTSGLGKGLVSDTSGLGEGSVSDTSGLGELPGAGVVSKVGNEIIEV